MSDNTKTTTEQAAEIVTGAIREVMAEYLANHEGTVSPYQIASVVNRALVRLGSTYEVRPQMMYNYDRNGLIAKGVKGVKEYTLDQVFAFAVKFVSKNVTKS